jgi:outer membrane immunogenic protein
MKKYFAMAAAAALIAPVSAHAEGYAQVQAGYDNFKIFGESLEGASYGVAAGYDLPITAKLFAGVEVSADDSSSKQCYGDVDIEGLRACVSTGRDLAVVARFGTNLSDTAQIYALGGYTNARVKYSLTDGIDTESAGENLDGFRLGAGFKQNLSSNAFVKVEYRYSNYEQGVSRHNALGAIGLNF